MTESMTESEAIEIVRKEKGSEDISPIDKFDQEHFEICGNIFDNPELL